MSNFFWFIQYIGWWTSYFHAHAMSSSVDLKRMITFFIDKGNRSRGSSNHFEKIQSYVFHSYKVTQSRAFLIHHPKIPVFIPVGFARVQFGYTESLVFRVRHYTKVPYLGVLRRSRWTRWLEYVFIYILLAISFSRTYG